MERPHNYGYPTFMTFFSLDREPAPGDGILLTNVRPMSGSRDHSGPMRGQSRVQLILPRPSLLVSPATTVSKHGLSEVRETRQVFINLLVTNHKDTIYLPSD